MMPLPPLPACWQMALQAQFALPYWVELQDFVAREREAITVFPEVDEVYTAFQLTPLDQVRVVILGQDPYPGEGLAHGLSFSVKPGTPIPASLRNIFRELQEDTGAPPPTTGDLRPWARQGVLLLNTVLTVRAGESNSHKGKGWEKFTDAVIAAVSRDPRRVVFILWGNGAQQKEGLIDSNRHAIIKSAHPSPLSASKGFFGSRPFSTVNRILREWGVEPIVWDLRSGPNGMPDPFPGEHTG